MKLPYKGKRGERVKHSRVEARPVGLDVSRNIQNSSMFFISKQESMTMNRMTMNADF